MMYLNRFFVAVLFKVVTYGKIHSFLFLRLVPMQTGQASLADRLPPLSGHGGVQLMHVCSHDANVRGGGQVEHLAPRREGGWTGW